MKEKKTSKSPKTATKAVLAVVVIPILAGIALFGSNSLFRNYAQDVGQPLVKELIDGGAVKVCEGGDPGKGPDQYEPLYGAHLEMPLNRSRTIDLLKSITEKSGFKIEHSTAVGTENVYSDLATKQASYPGIGNGPIQLTVRLSNESYTLSKSACHTKDDVTVNASQDRTAIQLDVKLPRSK